MTSLVKKLLLKPNHRMLLLNAPTGYTDLLGELPEGVSLSDTPDGTPYDLVQLFARNRAELEQHAHDALAALNPDGLLWLAFPKSTSKQQSDLTRDVGWDVIHAAGLVGIAAISLDDTWSALRFRPEAQVKRGR